MAASVKDESAPNVGKFHPNRRFRVTLSEDRRTASTSRDSNSLCLALSNDPIPSEVNFSVKVLEKGSDVSPISAASIPHTLDAPYMAGGAVHVIHCCLFFV